MTLYTIMLFIEQMREAYRAEHEAKRQAKHKR